MHELYREVGWKEGGETCRYWRAGWCPCPCAGPGPRMAKEGGEEREYSLGQFRKNGFSAAYSATRRSRNAGSSLVRAIRRSSDADVLPIKKNSHSKHRTRT